MIDVLLLSPLLLMSAAIATAIRALWVADERFPHAGGGRSARERTAAETLSESDHDMVQESQSAVEQWLAEMNERVEAATKESSQLVAWAKSEAAEMSAKAAADAADLMSNAAQASAKAAADAVMQLYLDRVDTFLDPDLTELAARWRSPIPEGRRLLSRADLRRSAAGRSLERMDFVKDPIDLYFSDLLATMWLDNLDYNPHLAPEDLYLMVSKIADRPYSDLIGRRRALERLLRARMEVRQSE